MEETPRLCPHCGADLDVWEEVFSEKHICFKKETKTKEGETR